MHPTAATTISHAAKETRPAWVHHATSMSHPTSRPTTS